MLNQYGNNSSSVTLTPAKSYTQKNSYAELPAYGGGRTDNHLNHLTPVIRAGMSGAKILPQLKRDSIPGIHRTNFKQKKHSVNIFEQLVQDNAKYPANLFKDH